MKLRRIAMLIAAAAIMFVLPVIAHADTAKTPVQGDISGDGSVDAYDALLALRMSLDIQKPTPQQIKAGDFNGDGVLDSADALEILKITICSGDMQSAGVEGYNPFRYAVPKLGIDVSFWQEEIDFNAVKKDGVDFVILRAGCGWEDPDDPDDSIIPTDGRVSVCEDAYFRQNYRKAKAAGLNVGVYWFSYAEDEEDVLLEAKTCLKVIKGMKLEYPVFFDLENDYQFDEGREFCSDLVRIFNKEIADAGYYPAFYMSTYFAETYLDKDVRTTYD